MMQIKHLLLLSVIGLFALSLSPDPADAQAGPPRVEILEPTEWSSGARGIKIVRRRSLRVVGSIENTGVLDQVRLNAQPIAFQEFPDGTVRFSGAMDVTEETGRAVVEVRRAGGESFAYEYTLQPALRDLPEETEARWNVAAGEFRGQRWALVIGISEYADARIPDLNFADQDADAIAEFLRTPQAGQGGFRDSNLLLIKNEEATYQNIRTAIRSWLRQSTPDDVIYVFIAGHGLPDPDRPTDLYLLPHDARLDNLAATAIPMEDFQRDLDRLESRATVVLADACHSAGVGTGLRSLGSNPINDIFLDRMSVGRGGLVTITSSQPDEISKEDEAFGDGHGVFTYYLLQGLQGAADINADRIVDVGEMFDFVQDGVRRATRNAQTPAISKRPFERAWPMSLVLEPGETAAFDDRDTAGPDVSASVFLGVYDEDQAWHVPDSLIAIIGVEEPIHVRLGGSGGERLPANLLGWQSSNERVARVRRDGTVDPLAPGLTTVTVAARNRQVQIPVRVYDRPRAVQWTPFAEEIELMRGEDLQVAVGIESATGQVVQGLLPQVEVSDTLVLSRRSDGVYRAVREGETTLTAWIGEERKVWPVRVRAPILRIRAPQGAVLLGDTLLPPAEYVRSDGSVLGEALGVAWESSDPDVIEVGLSGLIPRSVGRATVTAVAGSSRDEFMVTVLGDILYVTRGSDGAFHLRTAALRTGGTATLHSEPKAMGSPALSPNGREIAFVARRDGFQPRIYVAESDGTNVRRLTPDARGLFGLPNPFYQEHGAVWSHDGSKVFFVSNHTGSYQVYSVNPDGSGLRALTRSGSVDRHVSAAPDAPRIAFERAQGADDSDVIIALENGREPVNITERPVTQAPLRAGKPTLVAGNRGLLLVEWEDARAGEKLSLFDLTTRQRLTELVSPQRDHEILYAVSPAGDRIVYFQRPLRGKADQILVVTNLDGVVLETVELPVDETLVDLAWAAVANEFAGGEQ